MSKIEKHMFSLDEAAMAYVLAAERLFEPDGEFISSQSAVVPLFVSMLFQSLEISIKHMGIESGLFTSSEARRRENRSGHGIEELARLAVERLGGNPFHPVIMAMTFANRGNHSADVIKEMINGDRMEKTRGSYASRQLGYGEIHEGDFALIYPVADWIDSVKQTVMNLPKTIEILSQWRSSASNSKHFAIWLDEGSFR